MKSAVFEQDTAGTFVGGAYAFATPRDMAKLGQLYLNKGKWNGQTILSEDWIERTLTISPGYLGPGMTRDDYLRPLPLVYGGLMWLNRAPRPEFPKPFPKSPDDMFMALGRAWAAGSFLMLTYLINNNIRLRHDAFFSMFSYRQPFGSSRASAPA